MRLLLYLIFLILPWGLWAQSVPFGKGLSFGLDVHYGKLLRHNPERMVFEIPNPVTGLTLEVMRQTYGKDYWSAVYGKPRFGWVFQMHNFGNPEVLGTAWATYPQLDVYISRGKRFNSFFRMGFGLAYVDKPFDRVDNPENNAIGSHMNAIALLGLMAEYKAFKHVHIRFGGNVTHVSNGKTQLPNQGLNTLTLHAGIAYEIVEQDSFWTYDFESKPLDRRWLANLRFGIGITESKVPNGPKYPIYIFAGFATKMLSRKSKLQLGLEGSYNLSNVAWAKDIDSPEPQTADFQPWRFALITGHELMFGQFGFVTQLFFYLDPPFATKDFFGAKLGPNVYLYRPQEAERFNLFFGMYMKSHYQVADLIEATLGVSF